MYFAVTLGLIACTAKSNMNSDLDKAQLSKIEENTKAFTMDQLKDPSQPTDKYIKIKMLHEGGKIILDSVQMTLVQGVYTPAKAKRNAIRLVYLNAAGQEMGSDYYENLFGVRVCEGPEPKGVILDPRGWFEIYLPDNVEIQSLQFVENDKVIDQVNLTELLRKQKIEIK